MPDFRTTRFIPFMVTWLALLMPSSEGLRLHADSATTESVPGETVQPESADAARADGVWRDGVPGPRPTGKRLLREGEKITNQIGEFRMAGDVVTFHPRESEPIRVLENLALERIAKVLLETRGRREWQVSGVITEFRGANFLLVSRAVLKARPQNVSAG